MPILVRRSRLEVGSDSVQFPTVSGFNLNRQEFEFPRDFGRDLNLLFVPFLQPQQFIVNTWMPFANELEAVFPELAYHELPTIDALPALSRTFIKYTLSAQVYQRLGQGADCIRQAGFGPIQQEQLVLQYVRTQRRITRSEAAELCRLESEQAKRLLTRMEEKNLLVQSGSRKGAYYELAPNI